MHTPIGLVKRSVQTLEGLLLGNLNGSRELEEIVSCEHRVTRFTTFTTKKRTPYEMHYGRNNGQF